MPFENLNSRHFLSNEQIAIENNLRTLETAIMPKVINLTPEERQKYGSVNEQNKLIINKTKSLKDKEPQYSSPDVDWVEFENDFQSRAFIESTISRLQKVIDGLSNNKILHDYDNYQAALTDYSHSQYKAGTKSAGYESKVEQLSQFFNRTGTTNVKKENQKENPES